MRVVRILTWQRENDSRARTGWADDDGRMGERRRRGGKQRLGLPVADEFVNFLNTASATASQLVPVRAHAVEPTSERAVRQGRARVTFAAPRHKPTKRTFSFNLTKFFPLASPLVRD